MWQKRTLWYKIAALLLVMTFIISILAACGDGDDETTVVPSPTTTAVPVSETPTLTATPSATTPATATVTTTPTSSGDPVKLGAIAPWSGPMAVSGLLADSIIKLVEWQVKQQGGILGGRDVKVIKYDGRGQVADDVAGARKLILDDKVCVLEFGGSWGSEQEAIAEVAQEYKTLFVTYGSIFHPELNKFVVCAMIHPYGWADYWLLTAKMLKAKTVAILGPETSDGHDRTTYCKEIMKAAGIETVYEEYIASDVQDYSPYLTKVKYLAPDVVCWDASNEGYMSIGKQIMELGGWGKTTLLAMTQAASAATKLKGFEGQYVLVAWIPGLTYPGAIKYEQDYKTLIGGVPNSNHIYYYNSLWTAIYAIEMAGTDADRVKIAEAARSGNLEWDTPAGRAHITKDGHSGLALTVVHVEGGKLVPVTLPE